MGIIVQVRAKDPDTFRSKFFKVTTKQVQKVSVADLLLYIK